MGKGTKRKKIVVNNDVQSEDNSKNNAAEIQDNTQAVNCNTIQEEGNIEVVVESERNSNVDANTIVKKES